MPPNDQEPRYRLVDSNGNVVGSLFVNADGNVAIQDETATETEFTPSGITTPQIDTDSVSVTNDVSASSASVSGNITSGSVETDAVRTETIGAGDYHYAGDYPGADADARLDNALSAASAGDMVYLENATYESDRTINGERRIEGGGFRSAPEVNATWTVEDECIIKYLFDPNELILRGLSQAHYIYSGTITVPESGCIVTDCTFTTVTLESGTSANIVDTISNGTVTDNGNNNIGIIS